MKIGILSFNSRTPEPAIEDLKLLKAAQDLGHEALLIPTWECTVQYIGEEQVFWNEQPFPQLDLLVPRARFIDYSELQLHLLSILERRICVLNSSSATSVAKNKIKAQQLLLAAGLPVPHSIVIESSSQLERATEELGGFPLVLKEPYGTFGEGVLLVKSRSELEDQFKKYEKRRSWTHLILQEFIEEAGGKDLRLFALGEEVLAAMERQAQPGEFRSNIELGGTGNPTSPSLELQSLACHAVSALGLDYGGVDIVLSKRGPLILEVNANAGFKALEQITGKDIAGALIQFGVQKLNASLQ